MDRLVSVLEGVPVREPEPGWNCVEWVKEALMRLEKDEEKDEKALGTSVLGWQAVRDAAMWYVEEKAAEHRFDGKAEAGQFDTRKVATYDLVEETETILWTGARCIAVNHRRRIASISNSRGIRVKNLSTSSYPN
ncbi:hypothetical protein F4861DRAFT_539175 [Xylaria intraflava]|nr:hypothetical protein F4861DRAFT_539175 [Xylaria intraflava]